MDVIRLLSDSIANQIAAGEVVQRPASVVKELLENAIDSGADSIQLIIKDAGRTLVQVIDNGRGMSQSDARMCFERHATSKIAEADDLFRLQTKGFRGEALASIASVAHVELKTRQPEDELGTQVIIEGSNVHACEPCQTAVGSSFSVKNLASFSVAITTSLLSCLSISTDTKSLPMSIERASHLKISLLIHVDLSEGITPS
jgi:DNA mismatch repair protein MutL